MVFSSAGIDYFSTLTTGVAYPFSVFVLNSCNVEVFRCWERRSSYRVGHLPAIVMARIWASMCLP